MLLREHGARRIEAVAAGDRDGRLARLPRRIFARSRRPAPTPRGRRRRTRRPAAVGGREARVVGRAFVAELRRRGQRIVDHEAARVGEDRAQHAVVVGASSARWKCAARLAGVKCTRRSAVSADGLTVAALATHIAAADEQAASSTRRLCAARREDVGVAAGEAQRAQRATSGRSCGGSTACGSRGRPARASSPGPAAPRRADSRRMLRVALGREVAAREPGVVVRRPGDAVEVDDAARLRSDARFRRGAERHRAHGARPRRTRRARPAAATAAAESGRRAPAPRRRSRGNRRSVRLHDQPQDVVGQAVGHRVLLAERAPAARAARRTAWMSSRKHSSVGPASKMST